MARAKPYSGMRLYKVEFETCFCASLAQPYMPALSGIKILTSTDYVQLRLPLSMQIVNASMFCFALCMHVYFSYSQWLFFAARSARIYGSEYFFLALSPAMHSRLSRRGSAPRRIAQPHLAFLPDFNASLN